MGNPAIAKSYYSEETIHKVEVRDFKSLRVFLYISCDKCKQKEKCKNIKHKREICVVSQKLDKLIGYLTRCRVSGFLADEFYTFDGKTHVEQIKKTVKYLRMKYMVKQDVR